MESVRLDTNGSEYFLLFSYFTKKKHIHQNFQLKTNFRRVSQDFYKVSKNANLNPRGSNIKRGLLPGLLPRLDALWHTIHVDFVEQGGFLRHELPSRYDSRFEADLQRLVARFQVGGIVASTSCTIGKFLVFQN